MAAPWTGELIGKIHNAGLTIKQVAREASLNEKYVSQVLNSNSESQSAKRKLYEAFERLAASDEKGA